MHFSQPSRPRGAFVSVEPTGEKWRVGGKLGAIYYNGELLDLQITPDSVSLSLPPAAARVRLRGGTPPSLHVSREEVKRVSLGFSGAVRVESLANRSPLSVMTIAQNRAILDSFARLGYPTADDHPILTRARVPILAACLFADFAVLIGLVVAPGGWTFVALPVMWLVTLLWAFPRLW